MSNPGSREASREHQELSVSAVIATLGGPSLVPTVALLNAASLRPAEILICVPAEYASSIHAFPFDNIEIIAAKFRGQVAQRVVGFRQAQCPFVVQLDDDMSLDEHCLHRLVETWQLADTKMFVVAPALADQTTGTSIYKKPHRSPGLIAVYYWLMNGLTQSLAKEVGPRGIRVNGVCPVLIPTDGLLEALRSPHGPAKGDGAGFIAKFAVDNAALKRLPTGPEVAAMCVFLASDAASAVTAQNINVDCGVFPQ